MAPKHYNGVDDETTTTDSKPVVCFLGPTSSYTHQATLQAFSPERYELMPVKTIGDIFDTTQSGRATYGVVPFENSTNGSVVSTLDHFADRQGQYADLSVCAEIYQDVHHCLLGYLPPHLSSEAHTTSLPSSSLHQALNVVTPIGTPLASLAHIQRVYSHPQAWGQVTGFMNKFLKGIDCIDVSSTSRAAELAKADTTGTSAALSSALAAKLAGLDFLARSIEDRDDNTTRFFVLRRGTEREGSCIPGITDRVPKGARPATVPDSSAPKTKSLVSFTVPHQWPGALADVLECFRKSGLNLTSINSRPSLKDAFQYVFIVEFEGHRFADPEGRVQEVLERVAGVAQTWRWLGSWKNMKV
ncbi:prephenate dehydratase [Xylariales sp. AK1849]|nr:prephenate dehydratase [Xylariales sp. AK1849]